LIPAVSKEANLPFRVHLTSNSPGICRTYASGTARLLSRAVAGGLWLAGHERMRSAELQERLLRAASFPSEDVRGGYTGMGVGDRGRLEDLSQSQEIAGATYRKLLTLNAERCPSG
jgi:hypothetical protein